jgi:hypothetical protein
MTSISNRGGRGFGSEFFTQRSAARVDRASERFSDRFSELQGEVEARRGRGRGRGRGRDNDDSSGPPGASPVPPEASIQPVPNPPLTTSPQPSPSTPPSDVGTKPDDSVRSLAEKYVDVYSQQSGKPLSTATREALVNDVASFYGESGARTERLKTLVGVF